MTHVWNQSIHISEQLAKELIESQHAIVVTLTRAINEIKKR